MDTKALLPTLRAIIEQDKTLSTQSWEALVPLVRTRRIGKGDYIVREGQYYDHELFVLDGIVRGYYDAHDGQEANVVFLVAPGTAAHWSSRTVEQKSIISYQALKPAAIAEVHNKAFEDLMRRFTDLREFAFGVVFRGLQYKTMRERQLLTNTAEARYRAFLELYPGLENEIPHYHIASYLGITPVQLSRIRTGLAKGR